MITPENELWDDDCQATAAVFHVGCDGRVYWITSDEWRCIKCCQRVEPEEMKMEVDA